MGPLPGNDSGKEAARRRAREYRALNRDKINEQRRAAYRREDAQREARLAYGRKYRQRNREKTLSYARQKYLQDREARLAYDMFARHGLRPEDWMAEWNAQNGLCYLCGNALDKSVARRIAVDHDHSHCPPHRSCVICRRGLTCRGCNIAIGHAREDPARLRRMADALEAAQVAVNERKQEAAYL